jgi:hypothetical protein
MDKNQKIAIAVGVVVLAAIVIYFTVLKKPAVAPEGLNVTGDQETEEVVSSVTSTLDTNATSTATTSAKTTTQTTVKTTTKAPGAATLSYTSALKTYSASGYRFQVNNGRVSPGSMIVKRGKTFMIDNRDSKAHTVKVGSTSYRIAAYGFVIATAKTVGTNYIMVDGINAAKIEVE